jgi:hypothetical protein
MTTPPYVDLPLSTAQALAVAVLQGDLDAIAPLLDHLTELGTADGRRLVPVRSLVVDSPERLRAVFYTEPDMDLSHLEGEREHFQRLWQEWLAGDTPALALTGIARMEVYEIPEHVARTAAHHLREQRHREREEMRRHMSEYTGVMQGLGAMAQSRFPTAQQPAAADRSALDIEASPGLLAAYSDEQLRAELRRRGAAQLQAADADQGSEEDG